MTVILEGFNIMNINQSTIKKKQHENKYINNNNNNNSFEVSLYYKMK